MRTIKIGSKNPAPNTAVRVKLDNGKTVDGVFNGTAFVGADGAPLAGGVAYFVRRKTA